MEEWKEYRIGDICKIKHGFAFKGIHFVDEPQKYVCVTPGNFSLKGGFKNDKPKFYNGPIPEDYVLKEDDLIVTMTDLSKAGDTLGYSALVPKDNKYIFLHNQRIGLIVNLSPNIEKHFLYWVMRTSGYQKYIVGHCSGSTVKHTSPSNIGSYSFICPSRSTQKEIASILDNIELKIEINKRINDNLEQQAQALFKSWFVDFEPFKDGEFVESELGMIPKGWRVVSLDDMTSKFGTGLNPRKNFKLGEGNNYYVTIKNMGNNRVYLDDKCDKVTDEAIEKINKRSKLQEGDLLFSGIGTIGRVALITETPTNWNTSESVFNMHPAKNISSEFLYVLLLSDIFQQYVKIHAQGGVQQGIRMASLKEYRMAIPEDFLLSHFDDLIKPIISKIKNSDKQSDRLAELRDALLPKLMSGELKVNELNI